MSKFFNIFNPQNLNGKSLPFFCIQTFLVITPGTMLSIFLIRNFALLFGINDVHEIPMKSEINFNYFIKLVIFAPIIETLALSLLIRLVSMLSTNNMNICLTSAVVFAGMHGMNSVNTILGPFILFFAYSYSFMLWADHSYRYGYISACVPHALNNFAAFLLYYLSYRLS